MNDTYIVTAYVVIDEVLKAFGFKDDVRVTGTAAEILTVGGVAAKYFQNHHERALCVMSRLGYVKALSVSRFNRRLHALWDWLYGLLSLVGDIWRCGEVFIIDSMPLPVCKRARATRCTKVRGKAFCGYCAAKREKFFGWRLHLICTARGIPAGRGLGRGLLLLARPDGVDVSGLALLDASQHLALKFLAGLDVVDGLHTGALAASDTAVDALLRQAGVLRAGSVERSSTWPWASPASRRRGAGGPSC